MSSIIKNKTIVKNNTIIKGKWTPLLLPGVVGWWQVDETEWGLTIIEAAVPTNIQLSWASTNLTSKNDIQNNGIYFRLIDNSVNSQHHASVSITDSAAGLVTLACTVVGYGGSNINGLHLAVEGLNVRAGFNLTTRELAFTVGNVLATKITEIPGVGWRYSITAIMTSTNGPVVVGLLGSNQESVYIGDGTGYIDVTNVTLTQRRISNILNRIHNGVSLIQSTEVRQPKIYNRETDIWDGSAGWYNDGLNMQFCEDTTSIPSLFSGNHIPCGIYADVTRYCENGNRGVVEFRGTSAIHGIRYDLGNTLQANQSVSQRYDNTGASASLALAPEPIIGERVGFADLFDGQNRILRMGGIAGDPVDQTSIGACTFTGCRWGRISAGEICQKQALVITTSPDNANGANDVAMRRWMTHTLKVIA